MLQLGVWESWERGEGNWSARVKSNHAELLTLSSPLLVGLPEIRQLLETSQPADGGKEREGKVGGFLWKSEPLASLKIN